MEGSPVENSIELTVADFWFPGVGRVRFPVPESTNQVEEFESKVIINKLTAETTQLPVFYQFPVSCGHRK